MVSPDASAPIDASALLAALDLLVIGPERVSPAAASAWDAAWIACLSGSRAWAAVAHGEFVRAVAEDATARATLPELCRAA